MKEATPIKVENPCPFLLMRMKKVGDNYFCKSCSKTVVDFRDKSIEEIKCLSNKDTCGIFKIDQLKGQQRQKFLRQSIFYLLTVLSFLGFNVKPLAAQTSDTLKTKTETLTVNPKNKKSKKDNTDRIEKKEKKKRKALFRRKKKNKITIGCPAF